MKIRKKEKDYNEIAGKTERSEEKCNHYFFKVGNGNNGKCQANSKKVSGGQGKIREFENRNFQESL